MVFACWRGGWGGWRWSFVPIRLLYDPKIPKTSIDFYFILFRFKNGKMCPRYGVSFYNSRWWIRYRIYLRLIACVIVRCMRNENSWCLSYGFLFIAQRCIMSVHLTSLAFSVWYTVVWVWVRCVYVCAILLFVFFLSRYYCGCAHATYSHATDFTFELFMHYCKTIYISVSFPSNSRDNVLLWFVLNLLVWTLCVTQQFLFFFFF